MGGSAHKNIKVSRVSSEELADIAARLSKIFLRTSCFSHVEVPRLLPDKVEHGDVDLLVVPGAEHSELSIRETGLYDKIGHSYVINAFQKVVQVDLIYTTHQLLPLHKFLISYGDIGMMVGIAARWLGFKLGPHLGLQATRLLPVSQAQTCYTISVDPKEICDFFNLDHGRWLKGFSTEEEAFSWIRPLFCWDNERGKRFTSRREVSRPMVSRFMKRLDTHVATGPFIPCYPAHMGLAEIEKLHAQTVEAEKSKIAFKAAFNGETVRRILREHYAVEVEGRELGQWMARMRQKLDMGEIPTENKLRCLLRSLLNERCN